MSYQLYAQPNLAGSDVIRDYNLWSEYLLVDTIETDPIKITLQVADDNAETNSFISSGFTRNFRLPKSPNNDKLFKFATAVNNISYNPRLPLNAYITTDGALFSQGFLFLNSVSMNGKTGAGFYIVSFVNEVGSFITSVGDKYLSDLDTSELTHTRSYTNILESWKATTGFSFSTISATAGLVDGNILYPLMEWGYEYNADGSVNTNLTNTISQHACSSSFLRNAHSLYQSQFKPLVRTDWVWNRIFREAGYSFTYSSAEVPFFDSSVWKCLYTIQDGTNRSRFVSPAFSLSSLKYTNTIQGPLYWVDSDLPSVETSTDGTSFLPTGQLNQLNGRYIVPATGTYSIRAQTAHNVILSFESVPSTYVATYSARLFNYTTGTQLHTYDVRTFSGTFTYPSPAQELLFVAGNDIGTWSGTLTLDHEVKIQTRFDITTTSGGVLSNVAFIQNIVNMRVTPNTALSGVVKPRFTSKMKQKDFIQSITKKFKFIFEETSNKKILQITPWYDWIRVGENRNWSSKLDASSDFIFEPLFNIKNKTIISTDKNDTDWGCDYFTKRTKKVYGEFKYDSNIQTLSGEEKIETQLSPTALATFGICNSSQLNDGDRRFAIVSMSKDDNPFTNTGKREAIEPNVRLCYYNGTASIPNVSNATHWHIRNDLNVSQAVNFRPLISNFLLWPESGVADRTQTLNPNVRQFDINMSNADYLPYLEGLFDRTNNDAMGVYHSDYLNLFYDRPFFGFMNRKATCRLILYDKDLINFRFNTRVFVNGSWWFVSKIKDYQIGVGGSTEVELYQFGYANAKL